MPLVAAVKVRSAFKHARDVYIDKVYKYGTKLIRLSCAISFAGGTWHTIKINFESLSHAIYKKMFNNSE
jgi:hypothetical protein